MILLFICNSCGEISQPQKANNLVYMQEISSFPENEIDTIIIDEKKRILKKTIDFLNLVTDTSRIGAFSFRDIHKTIIINGSINEEYVAKYACQYKGFIHKDIGLLFCVRTDALKDEYTLLNSPIAHKNKVDSLVEFVKRYYLDEKKKSLEIIEN